MGLFKYILQGFGHTLGSEAARDALKKVGELADEAEAKEAEEKKCQAAAAKAREKADKQAAKDRAAQAKRDARDIDRELAAMKKKAAAEKK